MDQPPSLIRAPFPKYPVDLRQREVPGWVELEYVVGPDGQVEPTSIRVLRTTNGDFARSAVAAMKQAVYQPGIRGGARVRVRLRHVVQFRIRPH